MPQSIQLSVDVSMRILRPDDAAAVAAAHVRNRSHLSPWNPIHPAEYYAEEWHAADISRRLAVHESGDGYPFGLFAGSSCVGRFNLAGIVRGPLQSGVLSYWVDNEYAGRGLASAAVEVVVKRRASKSGCTASKHAHCCTIRPHKECCRKPGSSRLAWRHDTSRLPAHGRTTICTKFSCTTRTPNPQSWSPAAVNC